jgi:hypothetical protein
MVLATSSSLWSHADASELHWEVRLATLIIRGAGVAHAGTVLR